MTLFLIGIGGAVGAAARYRLGAVLLRKEKHTFPFGTLFINLIGSLLLGFFSGMHLSESAFGLLGDGFCGGFTTFSTFTLEGVQLICGKARKKAVWYILFTVLAGLLCFLAGYRAAMLLY